MRIVAGYPREKRLVRSVFHLGYYQLLLVVLFGLWRDLLPATNAFLHFWIVTWWFLAVMPEIGP